MNTKILGSLAAALVVTALAHPAIAESPGEHPAVLVARTWSSRRSTGFIRNGIARQFAS